MTEAKGNVIDNRSQAGDQYRFLPTVGLFEPDAIKNAFAKAGAKYDDNGNLVFTTEFKVGSMVELYDTLSNLKAEIDDTADASERVNSKLYSSLNGWLADMGAHIQEYKEVIEEEAETRT
jgi:hypothetical protein